jgi:predicted nuclease of predicted toxin-antitoxin system
LRRVLLDENLPRKLRRDLPEFAIRTVQEEGWASYANGQLLGHAQDSFDVLVTADRRLQFQQNLARFDIGVIVILTVSLRYRTIRVAIEQIRAAVAAVQSGELLHVQVPSLEP